MDASAEIAAETANLLLEDDTEDEDAAAPRSEVEIDDPTSLNTAFTQANLAGGRLNSMSNKVSRGCSKLTL